jgi:tetratricopeptide (TPR) repeat protein
MLIFIKKIAFFSEISVFLLFHKYERALTLCNANIKKFPNNPVFYGYLALILRRKGQIEEAIAAYRRSISLSPDVLADKLDLIELLYKSHKYNEVVIYVEEILSNRQKGIQEFIKSAFFDTLYWYLAFSYMGTEKYSEAVEFFEKLCLTRYKNNSDIYKSLGYCYQKLNQNEKATENYQKALKLGCDDKSIADMINEINQNY